VRACGIYLEFTSYARALVYSSDFPVISARGPNPSCEFINGITVSSWTAYGHVSFYIDRHFKRQGPFRLYVLKDADTVDLVAGKFKDDHLEGEVTMRTPNNELMMTGSFYGSASLEDITLPGSFFNAKGERQGKFTFYNYKGSSGGEWLAYHYLPEGKCGNEIRNEEKYEAVHETQTYRDGQLNGESVTYFINGKVQERSHYRAGKLDGMFERYNIMGTLVEQGMYDKGFKTGRWKTWGPAGIPASSADYTNGILDGEYRLWYSDGKPEIEENYVNGIKNGPFEEYYPIGAIMQKGTYDSLGLKDGLYRLWHQNGQLSDSGYYRHGDPDGLQVAWHPDGKLASKIFYKDGLPDGSYTYWHDNGVVAEKGRYENGELVDVKAFDRKGRPVPYEAPAPELVEQLVPNVEYEIPPYDYVTVIELPHMIPGPMLTEKEMALLPRTKAIAVHVDCDKSGRAVFRVTGKMSAKKRVKLEKALTEKLRLYPLNFNGYHFDCSFDAQLTF
jgi:antitoxin component YwqK of YwqJK toxin-antitoxin module